MRDLVGDQLSEFGLIIEVRWGPCHTSMCVFTTHPVNESLSKNILLPRPHHHPTPMSPKQLKILYKKSLYKWYLSI